MTGDAPPKPRRKGTLVSFEKLPNNYSVTISTSGASEKDPVVKQRMFSLELDNEWLLKKVDKAKLPIAETEFVSDGRGFIQGLWVPGLNAPGNGTQPATGFTPASEVKGSTNPQPPKETPPSTTANPPAAKEVTKKPDTARPAPSPSSQDDARKDPAWTNHIDKEAWLRYISTLNTATAILEGVWQPDPMKPQAENIADKIEWVQGIASGLRKRYEKDKGGA